MNEFKDLKVCYNYLKETGHSYEDEIAASKEDMIMIEDLDLTCRTYHALKRAGIQTIGDLKTHTATDIQKIRNLGKKSYLELKNKMIEMGIGFKDFDDNEEEL